MLSSLRPSASQIRPGWQGNTCRGRSWEQARAPALLVVTKLPEMPNCSKFLADLAAGPYVWGNAVACNIL
jgi:hypothetical protein